MLRVRGLVVRYGDIVALDGVDLDAAAREVVCVLGPSGCGKSTLLRAIAGLEPPAAGSIELDGEDLVALPPHRRDVGLMFQDLALFPHRDVAGNVAFGLRMQRRDRAEIAARVDEVLRLVGLHGQERRSISTLSGGEQQRVALARALAPAPRVLLLDEPLGSLDRALRDRLVVELRTILTRAGVTAIYVTHDQEEAFALGDRLVVLRAGRVEQTGTPSDVWARPANEFVARFLGFDNVLDAAVVASWGVPCDAARVVVRADAFRLDETGPVRGTVETRTFRGDHVVLGVRTPEGPVLSVAARWARPPDVGAPVALRLDASQVVPLPG